MVEEIGKESFLKIIHTENFTCHYKNENENMF
jgi:hypothetical protein